MARIRTVKPEFWSHPILGKQDDATKLMAVALLNLADDEGYFHAEPNLVRGFARPFDDNSTITRRCLDNLSKIGYISICDNQDYGQIGHVEKFEIHQKIDRPTSSKLKLYYSHNPQRGLDDHSLLEQGTGEQGTRESDFDQIWNSFHLITDLPKTDKEASKRYWKMLTRIEQNKAFENIQMYYDSIADKKYCKKLRTYLKDKNFNDEFTPKLNGSPKETQRKIAPCGVE